MKVEKDITAFIHDTTLVTGSRENKRALLLSSCCYEPIRMRNHLQCFIKNNTIELFTTYHCIKCFRDCTLTNPISETETFYDSSTKYCLL